MSSKITSDSNDTTKTDEAVWCDFKNGNREALSSIYQRYFRILIQYGLRISTDRDLVKDCIQDLFVEMWNNRVNLAVPQSVKAYLLSSIQRKVVRCLKKFRTAQSKLNQQSEGTSVESIESQIISEQHCIDQYQAIGRALNSLTTRQHEAVYLKFYTDLSYTEIAEIMKISTDSIYNLISKAIDILHREFSRSKR